MLSNQVTAWLSLIVDNYTPVFNETIAGRTVINTPVIHVTDENNDLCIIKRLFSLLKDCSVTGCAKCPGNKACEVCEEGLSLVDGKCHCPRGEYLTPGGECKGTSLMPKLRIY